MAQMIYNADAKEAIDPIIDLAIKRDYKKRLCQIYTILGSYYWFVEENYPKTFKALDEALKISGEVRDIVTKESIIEKTCPDKISPNPSLSKRGITSLLKGGKEGFGFGRPHYCGLISSLVLANNFFGVALGSNCEFERSAHYIQRAININVAAKNLWRIAEGYIQRYIGEILLNIGDQHISEAEHWIQNAIESDPRNRTMFHLGEDYALYADLSKRKGERLKAQENLCKAIEIFKECGADGWVEKYERELWAERHLLDPF